jgi:Protein of unknown function (DUF1580)
MIDVHEVHGESLISIPDACKIIPGRPHLATVYRWFTRGVRGGIKLETALVGGRRFTSREAVQRFVDRLSGERGDAVKVRTPRQRERAAAKANDELAKAGW